MAYTNPSVDDFKNYFVRDFPYGTDPDLAVLDQDIASSFMNVNFNINSCLFPNQGDYTLGYLLLSAHFLVMNLRMSSQGINGQFNFIQASKSGGPVSEAFNIPQMIMDNPLFAMYTKTNYGAMFLQMVYPQLAGQMYIAYGTTQA